ncbi:hypothetical protein AK812_SmicGene18184 [Symbiodinium microadriaticum]|uniref:Uncharacterized protein n=1 Tax=Symbiodinium microadriaticum TaxID=2951 RepID=A0A1Q9DVS6_SYMMI|nr:hypothetical protein AK812_SmicGene18184 [Symbiodinium microadriaticum]
MAACGWNDGALAPFSADPTAGAGWLMAKRIAQELLSVWRVGFPFQRLFRVLPDPQIVLGTIQSTMCSFAVVDLGEVSRLEEKRLHTKILSSLQTLLEGKVIFLVPSSTLLASGETREEVLGEEEDARLDPLLPPLASQIVDPMLFTLVKPA